MLRWITAAGLIGVLGAGPVAADPPALIDHTEWVRYDGLPSLRVYPTGAARVLASQPAAADGDRAWDEVLARQPDADTAGMREQFLCHWRYAELARPGKTSWNLEPWRPAVDPVTMLDSNCNPGAPEETD